METLRNFLRSPIRLLRSPGYSAASIVSIAVGLALATATFAFITSILFPPAPHPDADRVFSVRIRLGDRGANPPPISEQLRLLEGIPGIEDVVVSVSAGIGEPELNRMDYAFARAVSKNYWRFYGITPRLGRLPSEGDVATRRLVVSDRLWRQEFANRASLDGATIRIGNGVYDVIGVLPTQVGRGSVFDILLPIEDDRRLSLQGQDARRLEPAIAVKLKPGLTVEAVRPYLDRVANALSSTNGMSANRPLQLALIGREVRPFRLDSMEVLLYLLGFGVLAIGCTNVAALTLARGIAKRRDYALRRALGATRLAIAGEVIAEVAAVTAVGAAVGLGLAYALLGVLRRTVPEELTWRGFGVPTMDARAFSFCAISVLLSVAVAAAYPAWRASRVAPSDPLKDAAGTTTGRSRSEFRLLVVGELAIATVLLMISSLMTLSLRNIASFDYGFAVQSAITIDVRIGAADAQTAPLDARSHRLRALELVRSTPGVRSAAYFGNKRQTGHTEISSDRSAPGEPTLFARTYLAVGPGFFTALGVRVRQGRDFEEGDVASGAAIMSAKAAAILFPRADAVGRLIKLGRADSDARMVRVVGVSDDFALEPASESVESDPPVFLVEQDSTSTRWSVLAMITATPSSLVLPLQTNVRDLLPPRSRVRATGFDERLGRMMYALQYFTKTFVAIGFAALALGALGVFSVLSYVVGQREREFAVRISLGASPANLIRVVLRNALEFALGGTAIGALLSFWASAGASAFLFGVKNTDPVSLLITEAILIVVTLIAAIIPAIRAARANPLDIIRAS